MILKIVNVLALMGAVAWFARAPDWEPAILVVTLLGGLIAREWRDPRKIQAAERLKHDRALFRRYDELLSEQRLRNELDGDLYNHRTSSYFTDGLREWLVLANLEEGRFFDSEVHGDFRPLRRKLAELSEFIAVHFFMPLGAGPDPNGRRILMLYPDQRHDEDRQDFYRANVTALHTLVDQVEGNYLRFRKTVRERLTI